MIRARDNRFVPNAHRFSFAAKPAGKKCQSILELPETFHRAATPTVICDTPALRLKFRTNRGRPRIWFGSRRRAGVRVIGHSPRHFSSRSSRSPFPGTNVELPPHIVDESGMADNADFESLVARFYAPLYQFAFSLTRAEADACDLTQQTFTIWATKGHQLRDASKVKTWLFTMLHREFLESPAAANALSSFRSRHGGDRNLPAVSPSAVSQLDAAQVLVTLARSGRCLSGARWRCSICRIVLTTKLPKFSKCRWAP